MAIAAAVAAFSVRWWLISLVIVDASGGGPLVVALAAVLRTLLGHRSGRKGFAAA